MLRLKAGGISWSLETLDAEAEARSAEVVAARKTFEALWVRSQGQEDHGAELRGDVDSMRRFLSKRYEVRFDWNFDSTHGSPELAARAREAATIVVARRVKVRAAVRTAFLALYEGQKRLSLLEDALGAQAELIAVQQDPLLAAKDAKARLKKMGAVRAHLEGQRARAELSRARARGALAVALGVPAEALGETRLSFEEFEHDWQPAAELAPAKVALTHRADVLARLGDYAQSQAAVRSAGACPTPGPEADYRFDEAKNRWQLGEESAGPGAKSGVHSRQLALEKKEAARIFLAFQTRVAAQCKAAGGEVESARAWYSITSEMLQEQAQRIALEQRREALSTTRSNVFFRARMERATLSLLHLDAVVALQKALGALEVVTQSRVER